MTRRRKHSPLFRLLAKLVPLGDTLGSSITVCVYYAEDSLLREDFDTPINGESKSHST